MNSDFTQNMTMAMELRGFAKSTQKTYLAHMQRYSQFCGKHPDSIDYDDVRTFLHHAIMVRRLSSAYINSAYSAIKFYFQSVLYREWNMQHVPRIKKKSSLPVILSPQEVRRILDSTSNLKHKAKGNKDRFSILSDTNLRLLRHYWDTYRPKVWLFPGIPDEKPIALRTIQAVFKHSLLASGLSKDVSVHTLRHCFATHLLNQGASILQIKELLGHSDIHTTSMYLHLTHAQVLGLKSPLDFPDGGDDRA
jgi:integrase/recombinase XerD